jgi:hypothetical protein
MATVSTAKRSIEVTVLRPDAGPQTFTMAEGATLGDLLREAGAAIRSPNLLIDGRPIEDVIVLKSGMTIAIDALVPLAPPNGSWQATAGTFSHPEFWREVVAEGRAIREAEREAARNQPEQDDQ